MHTVVYRARPILSLAGSWGRGVGKSERRSRDVISIHELLTNELLIWYEAERALSKLWEELVEKLYGVPASSVLPCSTQRAEGPVKTPPRRPRPSHSDKRPDTVLPP